MGYVILGIVLIMVPGFLFSTALYPRRENLDFWARMAVSLGLGVMIAVFVTFSISLPGIQSLSLGPFIIGIAIASVVLGVLTYLRGGLSVIVAYEEGLMKSLGRLRKPRKEEPAKPAVQPEAKPGQPEAKPSERPKEVKPPEQPQTTV